MEFETLNILYLMGNSNSKVLLVCAMKEKPHEVSKCMDSKIPVFNNY